MGQRKYALVLSGGGFKGAFQEGALRYLSTHWAALTGEAGPMRFDHISGVSVGALNGALLAQRRLPQLIQLWDDVERGGMGEIMASPHIRPDGHVRLDLPALKQSLLPEFRVRVGMVLHALWNALRRAFGIHAPSVLAPFLTAANDELARTVPAFKGLADANGLIAKLDRYVSLGAFDPYTHFSCGLVSLSDGQYHTLGPDDFRPGQDAELRRALLASAMMPIVWPPVTAVRANDHVVTQAVDGGLRDNSPLGDVFQRIQELGQDDVRIIVINCSNGEVAPLGTSEPSLFRIALRSLTEITLAELFNDDVRTFQQINDLVRQARAQGAVLTREKLVKDRRVCVPLVEYEAKIIQPAESLGEMLDATPACIRARREAGYKAAEAAFATSGWSV